MGKNRGIGFQNRMPWHLPNDLKHFKKITSGHPVVMGRKTYESIGKPLPNRTNIVLSSREGWFEEGILIVGTIKEALKFAKKIDEDVCILGGGRIFEQTMDLTDALEVTVIDAEPEADVFFPEIDENKFRKVSEECHGADERHAYGYCFQRWERIKDE